MNTKLTLAQRALCLLMLLWTLPLLAEQTIKGYITNEWKDDRYTNHSNGTITDRVTGLMWKRCSEGQSGDDCSGDTETEYNWKQALQVAYVSTFAKHEDWRLPNIKELRSLVARDRYDPSINRTFFPYTTSSTMNVINAWWSSSPDKSDVNRTMVVEFFNGSGYGIERTSADFYVRLVRGGINLCHTSPCRNGGTCTAFVDDFVCACRTGNSGKDCSTATTP